MEFRRRWIGWSLGYKVIGNTFGIFLEFKFFETIILLFVFNVVLRHILLKHVILLSLIGSTIRQVDRMTSSPRAFSS